MILLILKKDLVSPDNVEYQISPENRDEAIQEMGAWGWRSISSQDNNDIQVRRGGVDCLMRLAVWRAG